MNFGLSQLISQAMNPAIPQAPQGAGIGSLPTQMPGDWMGSMINQGVESIRRDEAMRRMQQQGVAEMRSPDFIQAPPASASPAATAAPSPYINPSLIPQVIDSAAATARREAPPVQSVNADLGRTPDAFYHNPANFANDRMQGIALDRRDANADRVRRLSEQGMDMGQVERTMYPERFPDLRQQAAQSVLDRRGSGTAFNEAQGRVSADSRALKLMRMAESRGQSLPFALAYQMAQNSIPTTSDATAGNPSLPPLDITRMAGLGPAAAAAAGQTQIGLGQNENVSGRNQMDFASEQGRQSIARDAMGNSNQMAMLELLRRLMGDQHTQRNENRVLDDTLGSNPRRDREAAGAWLSSPAGQAARASTDPIQNQMYQQKVREFQGAANTAPSGGQDAAAMPTEQDLIKKREAALVANPAAMQQHLSQFTDPLARQREEARLYYENGRANEPSIFKFLTDMLERDNPNLHAGPDWMTTDNNRAAAAAKWAAQRYGVPENVAQPHYYSYFDN